MLYQNKPFFPLSMGDRKGALGAIEKVPQGKAEREMKKRSKGQRSRDLPSYLLHHELASTPEQRALYVRTPETERATPRQPIIRANPSLWQKSGKSFE